METFALSRKELHRPGLLKAALGGRLTNRQVAVALGLSVRHVRRLKRRVEAGGAPALGHRSRGRPSPRRLPPALRAEVMRLMTTVYEGFNDTHLTEKLREEHGLPISRESVRRLRCALGRPARRARRPAQGRRRRIPEAARGALVQIDGSPFAWLEGRGPARMLLGAVDDATTEILALHFRPPRMSTATPRFFGSSSPATACRWPSTAIASISWSATIGTGRSPSNSRGPSSPPTSAACFKT
jgi:transposase